MSKLKTAESVSPKHPDKICDQISDAILDAHLKEDENARVAVDVAGGHGKIFITGEVTSRAKKVDEEAIVRRLAGDVELIKNIALQSPEIARGVDEGGAGDQGIMIGFACNETPEFLPLEVVLARNLNQYLYQLWPFDGKTQVTICDKEIVAIVASFQHAPTSELEAAVRKWASSPAVGDYIDTRYFVRWKNTNPTLYINPAGEWNIGGFDADAGLTGRKLIVDNYGPRVPIGGGCFSGKDPSKVDRSAAYMARKIAIDYLRRFQAHRVYISLAYAIGYDQPVEAAALVDGQKKLIEGYDLSPNGIIDFLKLRQSIYEETARYGHFGHGKFNWEERLG